MTTQRVNINEGQELQTRMMVTRGGILTIIGLRQKDSKTQKGDSTRML